MSRRGVITAGGAVAAGGALTPMVFASTDSEEPDKSVSGSGDSGTTSQRFPATRTEAVTGTGEAATAFHTVGYNSGVLGIALIGSLDQKPPTDAAKASLVRLIKVISRIKGLDPQMRVTYTNPVNGAKKETNTVNSHRDYLDTECPGQLMYGLLTEVRAAAAGR